ncbi:MAG: alpha amylase C-terminal domain-containing protein, partial [Gammaproteobacteria bacterium]|nr:alpha amylase C-terminal domain-containing protein [Gammaproteobacteria bacterium]
SHDEVVHGKRSLLGRMPGDDWQRFANLRAYLANMYAHPGKKLLFMGSEIAQHQEWAHDQSLDWHLLEYAPHRGMQQLVRDLNRTYQYAKPLYSVDFAPDGFEWIDMNDRDNSILSWVRRDQSGQFVICVTNFTPVVRHDYRIGVPTAGRYRELINTDASDYGGSGISNSALQSESTQWHGRAHSLRLTVPALATLIIAPE